MDKNKLIDDSMFKLVGLTFCSTLLLSYSLKAFGSEVLGQSKFLLFINNTIYRVIENIQRIIPITERFEDIEQRVIEYKVILLNNWTLGLFCSVIILMAIALMKLKKTKYSFPTDEALSSAIFLNKKNINEFILLGLMTFIMPVGIIISPQILPQSDLFFITCLLPQVYVLVTLFIFLCVRKSGLRI